MPIWRTSSPTGCSPLRNASTMRRRVGSARVSKTVTCTLVHIFLRAYLIKRNALCFAFRRTATRERLPWTAARVGSGLSACPLHRVKRQRLCSRCGNPPRDRTPPSATANDTLHRIQSLITQCGIGRTDSTVESDEAAAASEQTSTIVGKVAPRVAVPLIAPYEGGVARCCRHLIPRRLPNADEAEEPLELLPRCRLLQTVGGGSVRHRVAETMAVAAGDNPITSAPQSLRNRCVFDGRPHCPFWDVEDST